MGDQNTEDHLEADNDGLSEDRDSGCFRRLNKRGLRILRKSSCIQKGKQDIEDGTNGLIKQYISFIGEYINCILSILSVISMTLSFLLPLYTLLVPTYLSHRLGWEMYFISQCISNSKLSVISYNYFPYILLIFVMRQHHPLFVSPPGCGTLFSSWVSKNRLMIVN